MKQDEMGTELVDHLTPEEKDSLSRLNPEITALKEKLNACRSNRLEVSTGYHYVEKDLKLEHLCIYISLCVLFVIHRRKQGKLSLR